MMTHQEIIDDVYATIIKEWSVQEQDEFFLTMWKKDSLSSYHHSLGQYIRNHYKLWSIPWTPELKDGIDYSPFHPDSVSMTIIEEVWKKGPW